MSFVVNKSNKINAVVPPKKVSKNKRDKLLDKFNPNLNSTESKEQKKSRKVKPVGGISIKKSITSQSDYY